MKVYKSFEQIEHDLKILKLQQQIDEEQLKLSINDSKAAFSPVSLIAGTFGAIVQKAVVLKAVNKILGIKKVKVKNIDENND